MNKPIAILIATFGLMACAPKVGQTTTHAAGITADDVQAAILETRPGEADEIYALIVTNKDGVITLSGKVEDESTHAEVISRTQGLKNVRRVIDHVRVVPKKGPSPNDSANALGKAKSEGAKVNP